MTRPPLWVILCHLPEKGRREIVKMKERDRGEKKINESEETEEIKTFPLYPYLLKGKQALPNCKPISVGRPSDIRYTTPLPHPTTPMAILEARFILDVYRVYKRKLIHDSAHSSNKSFIVKFNW